MESTSRIFFIFFVEQPFYFWKCPTSFVLFIFSAIPEKYADILGRRLFWEGPGPQALPYR
jgi:hypothetical protein